MSHTTWEATTVTSVSKVKVDAFEAGRNRGILRGTIEMMETQPNVNFRTAMCKLWNLTN